MINYSILKKYFTDNGIKTISYGQDELTVVLGTSKFGKPILITYLFGMPNVILCKARADMEEITLLDRQLVDAANKKFVRDDNASKMIINGNILEFDSLLSTQVSKEDLIKFSLSMMDVINNFK